MTTKLQPHFLQTNAWAKFQQSIGRETVAKSGDGWSYMAILEKGRASRRLYCPYGPTVDSAAALRAAVDDLKTEAKRLKADFIRIEPIGDINENDLREIGLRRSHHDIQPPHTVVNDVRGNHDAIMAETSQTVRRIWRKAEKAGVSYSVSYDPTDIKYFLDMIHDVAKRTGMKPHSDFYFSHIAASLFPDKSAGILFAELDGQKIAAIIFYTDGTTMSYAHAASFTEFRKLSPATALGLYALFFAHDTGCERFDFYGIAPDGAPAEHRWAGFTQFKLSFGGTRVATSGTWELPIKKIRYDLYKLSLKIARK